MVPHNMGYVPVFNEPLARLVDALSHFSSYTATLPEATEARVTPGIWCQPVEPPGSRTTFAIAMSADIARFPPRCRRPQRRTSRALLSLLGSRSDPKAVSPMPSPRLVLG